MKYIHLNGQLVLHQDATIHITDLGLLRGFGVFDFFAVRGGRPLFLADYLQRFQQSAQLMGMQVPLSISELERAIHELLAANDTFDAGIRLVLTGGFSPDSYTPTQPNLIIIEQKMPHINPAQYQNGIKLLSLQYTRTLPLAKTTNYIRPILQLPRLQEADAFDLLYFNQEGVISESSRANFFLLLPGNKIVTPTADILRGVIRHHVLEVAKYTGYSVEEGAVTMDDLSRARGAFLTSSIHGILPVVQIDDQVIGNGKPDPVCEELIAYWEDYVEQDLQREE